MSAHKSRLTKIVTLTLLASVTACSITQCHEDEQTSTSTSTDTMYAGEDACKADHDENDCHAGYEEASKEYQQIAPLYQSQDACQTTTGRACRESPDRPGMFLAPMAGFLLGMTAANALHAAPLYAGANPSCQPNSNDPNCRNRSAGGGGSAFLYSRSGYYGSTANTSSAVTSIARAPASTPMFASPARPSVVSVARGGFGATAAAHGGGGE